MTRRIVIGILLVLVLAAGAVGVGAFAYRAGVMQGLVTSGQVVAPPDGGPGPDVYVYPGPFMMGRGHWGFGGGFGLVSCLVPFLGLFLLFALLRLAFGHRHWGWRGDYGRWGGGGPGGPGGLGWGSEQRPAPPMFEEWHRRAHGEPTPPPPPAQPGQ